jgi:hypothetical protein
MINHFIGKRLIKVNQETTYRDCAQWKINTLEVINEGKDYLVDEDDNHFLFLSATFEVGEIVGIKVIDHLIFDEEDFHSMNDNHELKSLEDFF